MDTNSGFLRSIANFTGSSEVNPDLSPRDKRLLGSVEKALASFDNLEEWADYIAFLARLHKSLALSEEKPGTVSWVPMAEQVSGKLALCLSPQLPNGVHAKTLEVYEGIFRALDVKTLNSQMEIWLPGILPVISFGSMQVKPQVIRLYQDWFLKVLTPSTLRQLMKPLLLSLLCGLDDENSEVFSDVMELIDGFKAKSADNAHFWSTFFVCVITSPEKRLGALNWCNARLPTFAVIEEGNLPKFSAEAQACISTEPGLLVRAITAALNTRSSFNQATDIIVMRGFLDILLSYLPMDSLVISEVIATADRSLLIMACCRLTLHKDMSLNRRLWMWLLGPESSEDTSRSKDRVHYFSKHALPFIEKDLRRLISEGSMAEKLDAYRISLALVMDRWEISHSITPVVFIPVIESCFESVQNADLIAGNPESINSQPGKPEPADLLVAGKRFFDEVEASYIWHYLIHDLIIEESLESTLIKIDFLLTNFDFPDDENSIHVPFAISAFLSTNEPGSSTISILETLVQLLHKKSHLTDVYFETPACTDILTEIKQFYFDAETNSAPFSPNQLMSIIVKKLEQWYLQSMCEDVVCEKLASILCDLSFRYDSDFSSFSDNVLKNAILNHQHIKSPNVQVTFGIFRIYRLLSHKFKTSEKSRMLKIILTNLWQSLVSSYPANYQVEAVKCIFDMRAHFEVEEIEAGISRLLLDTPEYARVHAFYKLWSLSQDITESENLLSNPLFIILDSGWKFEVSKDVRRLIHNFSSDGTANRFLKIVTTPLLGFSLLKFEKTIIDAQDDLKLFAYHVETILNLLKGNEKAVKEMLSHEFVTSESAERFALFSSNSWDVSTYKSLLLNVTDKCFGLRLGKDSLGQFTNCISVILDLHSRLVTGTDPDFPNHFNLLIRTCMYYVSETRENKAELESLELLFIRGIREFLAKAKSANFNLSKLNETNDPENISLTKLINSGLSSCSSSMVLEQWLVLMKSSLHLLGKSVYSGMLKFNQTIINRAEACFGAIQKYVPFEECIDPESFLTICLSGIEDLLAIGHSYLLTPALSSVNNSQEEENGFLGNVISGVFQIESPLVKSEEQQRAYAVIVAFQDAINFAFGVWSWADKKPQVTGPFSSEKSITSMATKLRFRSKRFLESVSELERQETIESILETDHVIATKIKILHVIDSGHSQLSLSQILNSILTRCSPQVLTDKQKSTMYSAVTENQLTEFLVPYYASIDQDTLGDIWDMTLAFFKEVSLHPSNFKPLLFTILHAMKTVLVKAHARKSIENKRNIRELTGYFLTTFNAAVNKKAHLTPLDKNSSAEESSDVDVHLDSLTSLVESLSDILTEQDKITTAVTTITSSIILSEAKPKASHVHPSLLKLMLLIGKKYPIRAWKQVIHDTFMESAFFDNAKFSGADWQAIVKVWIESDKDKMTDLVNKITPPVQPSAANIFMWNERSEVETCVMVLRRISYLLLVSAKDAFVQNLEDIINRLGTALSSSCPPLYRSEALMVFRAISLRFGEGHLLPYWSLVVQTLVDVFSEALAKPSKQFNNIEPDELALILSACKLLDQLLLVQFDEVNLTSWLFVSKGSVANNENASSLIDRLAKMSESILTKEDPINVNGPVEGINAKPLLIGITEIKNIANLKKFFGSLGYINFERAYGLFEPDLSSCEADLLEDMRKR